MFHSGVCEKNAHRLSGREITDTPPPPPKFNVEQGHAGKRAEMGVFFAPPERPKPYLVNIELGQRGREVYIGSCSGWAFFSHTPVTDFCDISVPRGVVGCGPSVAP